jgi:hypothetical protein
MFHYFMLNHDPDAKEATKESAKKIVEGRLKALSEKLSDREFVGENFSIAEIVMTTVLKTAEHLRALGHHKNLANYIQRNESRPAFKRALKAHVPIICYFGITNYLLNQHSGLAPSRLTNCLTLQFEGLPILSVDFGPLLQ